MGSCGQSIVSRERTIRSCHDTDSSTHFACSSRSCTRATSRDTRAARGIRVRLSPVTALLCGRITQCPRCPLLPVMGQIFIIPTAMVLTSFMGVVITSCAAGFYPEEGLLWSVQIIAVHSPLDLTPIPSVHSCRRPYKLMEVIQRREDSHGARAAVFFLALSFFMSQLCVKVSRLPLRRLRQ